jgi:hypothetical protein
MFLLSSLKFLGLVGVNTVYHITFPQILAIASVSGLVKVARGNLCLSLDWIASGFLDMESCLGMPKDLVLEMSIIFAIYTRRGRARNLIFNSKT